MSIFISYSRKDAGFVRRLHVALTAQQRELWVDWEGIPPSADWMREIEAAIDAAEAFVFILSPDAAASAVCQRELAHAVAQNKRLLPVVCRDTDTAAVPPALARLNWIWWREQDSFDAAVVTLLQAVDTDLDWVRAHTRLLVRAVEWEGGAQGASLALRGSELVAAEQWLAAGPSKEPPPTELQTRYIMQSRQQATRRRMQLLGASAVATVVISVLGTLFVFQRQATTLQESVAVARRLASVSERMREQASRGDHGNSPLETSLQLAAEGMRRLLDIDARSLEVDLAVRRAMALLPLAVATPAPSVEPAYDFKQIVFTADRLAAVSNRPFTIHQWDARSLQALPGHQQGYSAEPVAMSADGGFVATQPGDNREGVVDVWAADSVAASAAGSVASASRIAGNGNRVVDVALFTGGTHAAVSTARYSESLGWGNGSTALWRTKQPQVVARLPQVSSMSFSPNGQHLAGQVDQRLMVWEMTSLLSGGTTPRIDLGPASWAEFSADGRHMIVVREDTPEGVEIWRVDGWKRTAQLPQALAGVLGPGGRFIAVRDADNSQLVRIVEVATQRERSRIFSSTPSPTLAFSPDGQRIAVGGIKRIDVWRIPEAGGASFSLSTAPASSASSPAPTTRLSFTADARQLMLFDPGGVRLWTPPAPQASARRQLVADGGVWALPSDGRHLLYSARGQAVMADAGSGEVRSAVAVPGAIQALALSPNARFSVAATDDRRLHLAQTDPAQVLASIELPGKASVIQLAVGADGEQVVVLMQHENSRVGQKLELVVWRRNATPPLATVPIDKHGGLAATVCALSAGGGRVAINNRRTSIQVRDTRSGADLVTADEAGGSQGCAFSADERYLAVTGADNSVRVWDLAQRIEIARIEALPDMVDMTFSADGHTLATLNLAGVVQTWQLRYQDLLLNACARLRSNLSDDDWARYLGGPRDKAACPGLTSR